MGRYVVVLVTCPTKASARKIATRLITERLAACVNILSGVESRFRWQGKIEEAREWLLLIKTERRLMTRLSAAVIASHPYEVPEVIALPLHGGSAPYLKWLALALRPSQ